ncbi:MAG TPA: YopT-type cysteine protease domain-containing protein [Acetobacteraceae bacterium]|nr:YopT-type cysteine protease domain-containing protein [Acetobacteraceae bacterium]
MSFSKTAAYRNNHNFNQDELLNSDLARALMKTDTGSLREKEIELGVCLALCLTWIRNKVLPLSERVRFAPNRLQNLHGAQMLNEVMGEQGELGRLWMRHDGDLIAFLEDPKAKAPQPVQLTQSRTAFSVASIVVGIIDTHVPNLMIYDWGDGEDAHAIVCYQTSRRVIVFDPNCGELSCPGSQIDTMWKAYAADLTTVFGRPPSMFQIAAVGVVPPKKKT